MARTAQALRTFLARWGGLFVALFLGSTLVAFSFVNYRDDQRLAQDMAVREGIAIFERMRLDLLAPDDIVHGALAHGARTHDVLHLALWEGSEPRVSVGKSSFLGRPPAFGKVDLAAGRARLSLPAWFGNIDDAPLPADAWDRVLVLEFEPAEAVAFTQRAFVGLVLSSGAAALLTLAAFGIWFLGRRAEHLRVHLERQAHLATLGQMSAVLAHEIRNPLAALKGHAQLVAESPTDPRNAARGARVVEAAVRLEMLSNDLLDFARSGAVRLLDAAPGKVLESAAAMTRPERVDLDLHAAPASWALDPCRMEQVLINLLENALHVTPDGSRVHVAVRVENDALVYAIRDHGPGVPMAERARVFEPFHTTNVRGTGLGLSVARRIVELHDGHVEIADAPGGGALFLVRVPSRPRSAALERHASVSQPAPARS